MADRFSLKGAAFACLGSNWADLLVFSRATNVAFLFLPSPSSLGCSVRARASVLLGCLHQNQQRDF